jgi:hypothetical protein
VRQIARALGKLTSNAKAIIGKNGPDLWIRASGVETSVYAEGDWPGEAVIAEAGLRALVSLPLKGDPIVVSMRDDRLVVEGLSFPCEWHPSGSAVVQLPLNPDLREYLVADTQYDEATLRASGVFQQVQDAKAERDKLLREAGKVLAPLGVSEEALMEQVRRAVRGRC